MTTGINKFEHFSLVELKICEEAFMLLRDCPELDSLVSCLVLRELFPQIKDAQVKLAAQQLEGNGAKEMFRPVP